MPELVAYITMLKFIFYILRYWTSKLGLKNLVFTLVWWYWYDIKSILHSIKSELEG